MDPKQNSVPNLPDINATIDEQQQKLSKEVKKDNLINVNLKNTISFIDGMQLQMQQDPHFTNEDIKESLKGIVSLIEKYMDPEEYQEFVNTLNAEAEGILEDHIRKEQVIAGMENSPKQNFIDRCGSVEMAAQELLFGENAKNEEYPDYMGDIMVEASQKNPSFIYKLITEHRSELVTQPWFSGVMKAYLGTFYGPMNNILDPFMNFLKKDPLAKTFPEVKDFIKTIIANKSIGVVDPEGIWKLINTIDNDDWKDELLECAIDYISQDATFLHMIEFYNDKLGISDPSKFRLPKWMEKNKMKE